VKGIYTGHWTSFLNIIIVLIFISCAKKKKKTAASNSADVTNRQMPVRVDGFIVRTQSISENVEVPGTIIANEATEIHPEISGRIVYLNVREGAYVPKGTVLARLYSGDLQAQLNKYQVQQQIAEQKTARLEQLVKIGGISQQDYELGKLEVNNIKSDIEILKANISRTVVRAPFAGKLGLKNISPGAYVTPTSIIATIQQTSQLKLDFTVPEKYSGQIKPGQLVTFSYQGANRKFLAKVIALESSVAEATRTMMVRSVVQDKDATLIPGGFAKVILNFEPDPNALMVPSQAILPQAKGKKVILYNGGKIKFQDITTGIRDSSNVQVTSGLKAGDTIVITGLMSARPDGKIQLARIVNL
jgi:membrane fusion protein (multidrug efflux system)